MTLTRSRASFLDNRIAGRWKTRTSLQESTRHLLHGTGQTIWSRAGRSCHAKKDAAWGRRAHRWRFGRARFDSVSSNAAGPYAVSLQAGGGNGAICSGHGDALRFAAKGRAPPAPISRCAAFCAAAMPFAGARGKQPKRAASDTAVPMDVSKPRMALAGSSRGTRPPTGRARPRYRTIVISTCNRPFGRRRRSTPRPPVWPAGRLVRSAHGHDDSCNA